MKCPNCETILTGASVIAGVEMGNPDAMCDDCQVKKFNEQESKDGETN